MRSFYLHSRKGVFYAELIDPQTKLKVTARSTKATNRDEAVMVAYDWLRNGIPDRRRRTVRPTDNHLVVERILRDIRHADLSQHDCLRLVEVLKARGLLSAATIPTDPGSELLKDFLVRFWSHEVSPYASEKKAFRLTLGKAHCDESLRRVKSYWIPYFGEKTIAEITRADIKTFSLHLAEPGLELAPGTRNRILTAGRTALRWAADNRLLSSNPCVGLPKFAEENEERGIITMAEARILFSMKWDDEKFLTANLLAATTGLRAGEIVALRREDIGDTFLHIRHSYLEGHGLKLPKTNRTRRVPVLPEVRLRMLKLAALNPHGNEFVFWGTKPDAPMVSQKFSFRLREMLVKLSVERGEEKLEATRLWEARNVLFHSWRHFFSTRLSRIIQDKKVMKATGHTSEKVFKAYADHELENDLETIGGAAMQAFSSFLPLLETDPATLGVVEETCSLEVLSPITR